MLFAHFAQDDAYLINIYPHQHWTKKDLLEFCIRNWPAAGIARPVQGLAGLSQQFTEDEQRELRNAGVAQLQEIGGRVYMPAGQTTARTPIAASLAANKVHWSLESLREPDLTGWLNEQTAISGRGKWQPHINADEFGFLRAGVFLRLGRLV